MKPTVTFFEWSNLNSQPLVFKHVSDFEKFCKKSKITISSNNEFYLTNNIEVFAVCPIGKSELVLSGDIKNLKKNFNKHNKKNMCKSAQ